jgi:glucose-6-phosphate dehydrogenase assembly protein OpcA
MSGAAIYPAHPENILKGLGKLWTSLGQEESHQGKPTVMRACAMTLIVATDEPDCGFYASQTISELMREHPSRGIVLAIDKAAENSLEARVLAQCWKPFGKAQQICCEQIEILSSPDHWPNVGPTLVGLTVADLPVIFWCRHKGALKTSATEQQSEGLEVILDLSSKVIIDTGGEDTASSFALISRLRREGRVLADLEWARLTFWREPFAQIFDNPARTNHLSDFHTIEIFHTDARVTPLAAYAAGWFASVSKANITVSSTKGFGPGLHAIRMVSEEETITFERTGTECARFSSSTGRQRSYSYAEPSLFSLLHQELSILGEDRAFNAAFARAGEFVR